MITPTQCRMARAARCLTIREVAKALDISFNAISRYERGDTGVISVQTMEKLEALFTSLGVYFGPHNGVCFGNDAFKEDRWLIDALASLLNQHGIRPSSADLFRAHEEKEDDYSCAPVAPKHQPSLRDRAGKAGTEQDGSSLPRPGKSLCGRW